MWFSVHPGIFSKLWTSTIVNAFRFQEKLLQMYLSYCLRPISSMVIQFPVYWLPLPRYKDKTLSHKLLITNSWTVLSILRLTDNQCYALCLVKVINKSSSAGEILMLLLIRLTLTLTESWNLGKREKKAKVDWKTAARRSDKNIGYRRKSV